MSGVPSYPSSRGLPGYSLQVKELAHLLLQRPGNRKPNKSQSPDHVYLYSENMSLKGSYALKWLTG